MSQAQSRYAHLIVAIILLAASTRVTAQQWTPRGITEPYKDATLSAAVAGEISRIHRQEGERVRQGDVILELEREQELLEVERRRLISESKEEVNAARHRLDAILLELERKEKILEVERRRLISESKVEVTAIEYRLETLKTDLDATRQLYEKTKSVSKEELEHKVLEYKLTQAELRRLLIVEEREAIEYRIAQAQLNEERQQKEAEYKLAQAELKRLLTVEEREAIEYRMAREQLKKYLIRAPFDGVIVKVFPEIGESCTPQQPLVRIADVSKCRLIIHMEAAASRVLKPDQQVRLRIDGVKSPDVFQGMIENISPVVDPSSGLREVKVLFDNPQGTVNPGLTGTLVLR